MNESAEVDSKSNKDGGKFSKRVEKTLWEEILRVICNSSFSCDVSGTPATLTPVSVFLHYRGENPPEKTIHCQER